MNHYNLQRDPALREQLAAEYVLGTLKGGARKRFESWMQIDATIYHSVMQWQGRINPMAELSLPVAPPAKVWSAIENRLGLFKIHHASKRSLWHRVYDNVNFWRGLGIATSTLATLLVIVLVMHVPQSIVPQAKAPTAFYVATLTGDQVQPAMIVTGDTSRRTLTFVVITPQQVGADKSLELWALPAQGAPQSLGLVAASGAVTVQLPENVTPLSMPVLAVSLEARGGSDNPHAPTGPVLFKGAWTQL